MENGVRLGVWLTVAATVLCLSSVAVAQVKTTEGMDCSDYVYGGFLDHMRKHPRFYEMGYGEHEVFDAHVAMLDAYDAKQYDRAVHWARFIFDGGECENNSYDPRAIHNHAVTLHAAGRHAEARQELERALTILEKRGVVGADRSSCDPSLELFFDSYARLERDAGNAEKAEQLQALASRCPLGVQPVKPSARGCACRFHPVDPWRTEPFVLLGLVLAARRVRRRRA